MVKLSIIGLVDYKSDVLLRILENWANTSSTVVLEGLTFLVVKACREFECSSRILSSSSGVISITVQLMLPLLRTLQLQYHGCSQPWFLEAFFALQELFC